MRLFIKYSLVLVLVGLISIGCAPAAPMAPPTAGEEAADPAAEDVVELRFQIPERASLNDVVAGQIDRYMEENPNVFIELIVVPNSGYSERIYTQIAAGDAPDLFLLRNDFDIANLASQLVGFSDYDDFDAFLAGGRKSVSTAGDPLGLPWIRSLCTSSYDHLVVYNESVSTEISQEVVAFLTNEDNQIQNFEENYWFPTRAVLDGDLTKCPEEGWEWFTAAPDPKIAAEIAATFEFDALIEDLESVLKNTESEITGEPLMRADTGFDTARISYLVNDGDVTHVDGDENSVVSVPIAEAGDLSTVSAPEAMSVTVPNGLVIGAFVYGILELDEEGEFVDFIPNPDRTYGVYVQSYEPLDLTAYEVYNASLSGGFELDEEYITININGNNNENSERFIGVPPFANFAVSSPGRGCFYWEWVCMCRDSGG